MATFEQKGDFEVVKKDGGLQKNGGNVVSYFCTPGGRILHAVVGPVSPEKLLAQAVWTVDVYWHAKQASKKGAAARNQVVREAHQRALGMTTDQYAHKKRSASRRPDQAYYRKKTPAKSWEQLIRTLAGSREEKLHRLFATRPLPRIDKVDTLIFRYIANEPVNDQDGSVGDAVAAIAKARRTGRPVMFVLYRQWDSWRRSTDRRRLLQKPAGPLFAKFTVINLPIKELPALSAQVSGFTIPDRTGHSSATLVLTDSMGNEIATLAAKVSGSELAQAMYTTMAESQFAIATALEQQGKIDAALKRFHRAYTTSKDKAVKQRSHDAFDRLAMQRAKGHLEEGSTLAALRLLRRIEKRPSDQALGMQATELIAQTRAVGN